MRGSPIILCLALMEGLFFFPTQTWSKVETLTATVEIQQDSLHIEFFPLRRGEYKLEQVREGYRITLPEVDKNSQEHLNKLKSSDFLEGFKVQQDPSGQTIIDFALKSEKIELFDYLTTNPNRWILDIYPGDSISTSLSKKSSTTPNTTTRTKSSAKLKAKSKSPRSLASTQNKTPTRNPASETLVIKPSQNEISLPLNEQELMDGTDLSYERFQIKDFEIRENSIIASKEKVFLFFPMFHLNLHPLERLEINKPIYEVMPKDGDENQQARLLVFLYKQKRHRVFDKVVEWFLKKYPQSEYNEIIYFLMADNRFSIWMESKNINDFDVAMLRYRRALEKFPESPLAERCQILMGFANLERGDYLSTLKLFLHHIQTASSSQGSPNKSLSQLAIAAAYLKINKYEEALDVYSQVEKNSEDIQSRQQAAFLKGDAYCQKKDYKTAIDEYRSALKKYPEEAQNYPNALYNQGLSLFQDQRFKEALEAYLLFLKISRDREYSAYALTRIGELLDIMGAPEERSVGAFKEAYFRFGDVPSTIVARLHLMSLRFKTMKAQELENTVEEITTLARQSQLPGIEQFATLMISEGYAERTDYDRAMNLLVSYYQSHPNTVDSKLFTNRIIRNINDKIHYEVFNKKYVDALKIYHTHAENWLKNTDRMDTGYFLGFSFEQLGVYDKAEKLYQNTLSRLLTIQGTPEEKERRVIEKIPSLEELYLRLAIVSERKSKYGEALELLKKIQSPEKMTKSDQIERIYLMSQLLDKKGDTDKALVYLNEVLKAWSGNDQLLINPYFFLSQLQIKQNKSDLALKSLNKVDSLIENSVDDKDSEKFSDLHIQVLSQSADLYKSKKNWNLSKETYEKLLDLYEKNHSLDNARYYLGQLYFQEGNLKKAQEIWEPLKKTKDSFWSRLAQEDLTNHQWQQTYKRYVNRIPAMIKSQDKSLDQKTTQKNE